MTGRSGVEFHPDAAAEAQAAFVWYQERSNVAAQGFLAELDRAVARVEQHPDRWPSLGQGLRRCNLRGFPFFLVYGTDEDVVQIVAVSHGHRRPGYWRGR
ncbi:MAG: type II toxin-antitoxin system RelE/ParE family toxin [Dehalococcoidia bacterium]|nr:type II toxin-antitoxin system RelE/ParE family toxin [Dehalococcoidia bacterium]